MNRADLIKNMSDIQLLMAAVADITEDGLLAVHLKQRAQELRTNLPKSEHIRLYGEESWNTNR